MSIKQSRGVLLGLAVVLAVVPVAAQAPDCTGISGVHNSDPDLDGELTTVLIASGLTLPLYVTSPPGDMDRLFIVEQDGRIKILRDGAILATLFLDISAITQSPEDSGGISGYSGNPGTNFGQNCNACHGGGVPPTVTLSGPTTVSPGSLTTYTLTLTGGQQTTGGLGVSVTRGELAAIDTAGDGRECLARSEAIQDQGEDGRTDRPLSVDAPPAVAARAADRRAVHRHHVFRMVRAKDRA